MARRGRGMWLLGAVLFLVGPGLGQNPPGSGADLGKHKGNAITVAFSPDGKLLASGGHVDGTVRLWELSTGKEVHTLTQATGAMCVRFSPDGKLLASSGLEEAIRLWDPATGKEVRKIDAPGHAYAVAFAPDGSRLASAGIDRTVRLYEVPTGKLLWQAGGHTGRIWGVDVSPDGKRVASAGEDGSIRLWDAENGKELVAMSHGAAVVPVRFSPDGKTLASGGADSAIRLWEVASGKEQSRLLGHKDIAHDLAFSTDGRWLASAGYGEDRSLRVWELATGLEALRLDDNKDNVLLAVALSRDGLSLASAGKDMAVRRWDATGRLKNWRLEPVEWTPRELDGLWEDLNGTDAKKAYRATWALAASPRQTVTLFKDRLRPAPEGADVDKLIARHIRDLDDARFGVRDRASHLLGKQGRRAEKALRKALDEETSAEVRSRVKVLLEKLEGTDPAAEAGPPARAAAVLERLGTPEARQLLKDLARGDSRLADEARASLSRIEKGK